MVATYMQLVPGGLCAAEQSGPPEGKQLKARTNKEAELWHGDSATIRAELRRAEQRQWWLSFSGVAVTLVLTLGIVSFSFVVYLLQRDFWDELNIHIAIRALVGMVLLFSVYVIYQQWQIHRFRMRLVAQEELFRLIGENAVDMIAVVTAEGQRLTTARRIRSGSVIRLKNSRRRPRTTKFTLTTLLQ